MFVSQENTLTGSPYVFPASSIRVGELSLDPIRLLTQLYHLHAILLAYTSGFSLEERRVPTFMHPRRPVGTVASPSLALPVQNESPLYYLQHVIPLEPACQLTEHSL